MVRHSKPFCKYLLAPIFLSKYWNFFSLKSRNVTNLSSRFHCTKKFMYGCGVKLCIMHQFSHVTWSLIRVATQFFFQIPVHSSTFSSTFSIFQYIPSTEFQYIPVHPYQIFQYIPVQEWPKIAFKLSTMVGENFEFYLSQMA